MDTEFLNLDIINKVITPSGLANGLLIRNKMRNVIKLHLLVFHTPEGKQELLVIYFSFSVSSIFMHDCTPGALDGLP